MAAEIKQLVQSCEQCEQLKSRNQRETHSVGMDLEIKLELICLKSREEITC